MRVVLPAPFSPSKAITSPLLTEKLTASFAVSSPKHLVIAFRRSASTELFAIMVLGYEGSPSLIITEKAPDLISACRLATNFIAAAGTLPSNVPSGASSVPPCFMKE